MAQGNVKIVKHEGDVVPFRTDAGSTAILPGEPTMIGGGGNNYAIVLTDAKPVVATDEFLGIALSIGTHTSTADGVVNVGVPQPNKTVLRAKAKDTTAIDTDAELLAILNDNVLFDLTGTAYTIDEGVDGNTAGLMVRGGDIVKGTLDVVVKERAMNLIA